MPWLLTMLEHLLEWLQGEAIEEAVRRETREEAGVPLVAVDIVGSQPWPVGEHDGCCLLSSCCALDGSQLGWQPALWSLGCCKHARLISMRWPAFLWLWHPAAILPHLQQLYVHCPFASCHAMPCPCRAMPRHVMPCCAMPCHAMPP